MTRHLDEMPPVDASAIRHALALVVDEGHDKTAAAEAMLRVAVAALGNMIGRPAAAERLLNARHEIIAMQLADDAIAACDPNQKEQ